MAQLDIAEADNDAVGRGAVPHPGVCKRANADRSQAPEEPMDYFSEVTIPKMRESDRKRILSRYGFISSSRRLPETKSTCRT